VSDFPRFERDDRVLVVAPHPDDEAIATGGMLQAARAAGARCRVLVATDGDNNPWPQRWIEKRWRIDAADRARWGARRRAEALAALQVLGADADSARCLGFPDLGLTLLLMSGDGRFDAALAQQFDEVRPTFLFVPALHDRHPDHSALHVAMCIVMARGGAAIPQLFTFGVHGEAAAPDDVVLALSDAQRDVKREAIMQHATQMRLSRRRFLAYATTQERFRRVHLPEIPQPDHPLHGRIDADGTIEIRIDHARWGRRLRGYSLLLVARGTDGEIQRRRIDVLDDKQTELIDTVAGSVCGSASVEAVEACTKLTFSVVARTSAAWIKLATPLPGLFVLDRAGWQTVDVTPT